MAEAMAGRRAVLAVDVAKVKFVAALQVAPGQTLVRVIWAHPFETAELLAGLAKLAQAGALEVVMESSGVYGDALRRQLQQRGIDVYRWRVRPELIRYLNILLQPTVVGQESVP